MGYENGFSNISNKIFSEKTALKILLFGLILIFLSLTIFLIFGNWQFSSSLKVMSQMCGSLHLC